MKDRIQNLGEQPSASPASAERDYLRDCQIPNSEGTRTGFGYQRGLQSVRKIPLIFQSRTVESVLKNRFYADGIARKYNRLDVN